MADVIGDQGDEWLCACHTGRSATALLPRPRQRGVYGGRLPARGGHNATRPAGRWSRGRRSRARFM
ncbi:hypothetical protein EYF80_052624 [Liparis tanakae]|uniref:Uncharacterized protein n=1 Tax=Liparis tanakae TaxID=230148 RepID=A0A4Z2F882_9TELE|nr:hypothetical protein EYF80_052624 [Liparis tanakae]